MRAKEKYKQNENVKEITNITGMKIKAHFSSYDPAFYTGSCTKRYDRSYALSADVNYITDLCCVSRKHDYIWRLSTETDKKIQVNKTGDAK